MSKRSLEPRCNARRSWDDDQNLYARSPDDVSANQQEYTLEKRNPVLILLEIAGFAARLGVSLASRVASAVARYSPRLAQIADKAKDRMFQLAPRGQAGARGGWDEMKTSMERLAKNDYFKKCLKDGKP